MCCSGPTQQDTRVSRRLNSGSLVQRSEKKRMKHVSSLAHELGGSDSDGDDSSIDGDDDVGPAETPDRLGLIDGPGLDLEAAKKPSTTNLKTTLLNHKNL